MSVAFLGSSNGAKTDRAKHDFYGSDPRAMEALLAVEKPQKVWEPHAGELGLVTPMRAVGIEVKATDIVERSQRLDGIEDFLEAKEWRGDIVMNPPYADAETHIRKALSIIPRGRKVYALLRFQFAEGIARKRFFDRHPPRSIYVFSWRVKFKKNGQWPTGNAVCYAWYLWHKGWSGQTVLKWL